MLMKRDEKDKGMILYVDYYERGRNKMFVYCYNPYADAMNVVEEERTLMLTDQMIREMYGKINGTKKSPRKAAASRENGKKGGRPKKVEK